MKNEKNAFVPEGDSKEDVLLRKQIIIDYYRQWGIIHPERRVYNRCLKDYIYVKGLSVAETAYHASKTYLSTLAVLQLDAILSNSTLVETTPINPKKKNQKGFIQMLRMAYNSPGIGAIKMLVGVKQRDKSKVQYCITALNSDKTESR